MAVEWLEFARFPNAASAEVVAGLLRAEGVPVEIVTDTPLPGLAEGVPQREAPHREPGRCPVRHDAIIPCA